MGREVKKTVIKYESSNKGSQIQPVDSKLQASQKQKKIEQLVSTRQERERSRQRPSKVQKAVQEKDNKQSSNIVTVDVNSRKARLQAMKKARQLKEKQQAEAKNLDNLHSGSALSNEFKDIKIVVIGQQQNLQKQQIVEKQQSQIMTLKQKAHQSNMNQLNGPVRTQEKFKSNKIQEIKAEKQSSQQSQEQQGPRIIHRPVFLSKQDRSQLHEAEQIEKQKQLQRRKKNLKYTTKILLQETLRKDQQEDSQEEIDNKDDQDQTNLPDDSDNVNEELEYELWKIRELKRIRRDRELRQKHIVEKAQIQRRRQMNNQQILLENRLLGSDSTDNDTQTKYVFMQKYYHKGAFYQDSNDPIFQRDYNLPTPMQMQDKSGLPQVLQKRKGNFGKRGQSKYTHLTAEDTTDTNPLTRADESLLNSWKKKMAGYKK